MKGVLRSGGLVLAAAGLVVVGRSWSGPPAKPAAPKTRVAFVNMAYVFKHSRKWQGDQALIKENYQGFEKRAKELAGEIEEAGKAVKNPDLSDDRRCEVAQSLAKLRKELEDHNAAAKRELGGMSDRQMSEIFKAIQQASERYAKEHDLDAVLMYTETIDPKDYFNPNNIIAKLQNRASMPLYLTPGMDVSPQVVEALNAKKSGLAEQAKPAKP